MIEYQQRGDVSWITIDRPEKLNCLTLEGWEQVREGLDRAAEESRVAVLTGSGRAFSAGDDIGIFDDFDSAQDLEALGSRLHSVFQGIEQTPIPVIAAVNGLAYGGGCEIVAACDLAVAVEDAEFSLPETRIGVYPAFAVKRMAAFGGRKRCMELALTGEPIDAKTARKWGLVNHIVADDQLETKVTELTEQISESPKRSIRLTKEYINEEVVENGERNELMGGLAHLFMSAETKEGIQAFVEDRKPSYQS